MGKERTLPGADLEPRLRRKDEQLVHAQCRNCDRPINIWGGPLMTTPDRPYASLWGRPYVHGTCPK